MAVKTGGKSVKLRRDGGDFIQNVSPDPDLEKLIARWRKDLARFVDEAILAPYNASTNSAFQLTWQQREGLEAVQKLVNEKDAGLLREILGVSIMSGRGTGKDALASWVILWFMTCFSYPKVPCVSVSADQLNKVLWSEISKWLMHSPLKTQFKLQNDKLFAIGVPAEVRGKRWIAFPKAANPKDTREEQVEGLAGIHEKHLLQVIDEGSGVLSPVFEALEGNMTGKVNLMLLIFNPTRTRGYAVESQYENARRWIALRWNAENSELVEKPMIEALEKKFGKDSNPYRIRVLGLPPLADEHTLIPWDWIEDAVGRPVDPRPEDPLIKGVDCGAGGDSSVIATRKGPLVYGLKRLKTPESTVLSNWIGVDIDAEKPDVVRIDTLGIGWAVEGAVREKKGAIVEAADVRRQSDDPERFENKRAEMYWRLREAFERGAISIPDDEELKNQLGAIRCEYGLRGRIKIMEKKRLKHEMGHSPDEADALAITYFHPDIFASRKTGIVSKPRAPSSGSAAWMEA